MKEYTLIRTPVFNPGNDIDNLLYALKVGFKIISSCSNGSGTSGYIEYILEKDDKENK